MNRRAKVCIYIFFHMGNEKKNYHNGETGVSCHNQGIYPDKNAHTYR